MRANVQVSKGGGARVRKYFYMLVSVKYSGGKGGGTSVRANALIREVCKVFALQKENNGFAAWSFLWLSMQFRWLKP